MSNPVVVEVTRGNLVESQHRGIAVVVDGDGGVVFSAGDVNAGVFPRSSCKAMQALPLMESGAADAYGFGNKELALACSSHSGEDAHAALAKSMVERAGLSEADFECGSHWAFQQESLIHQARTMDQPTPLYNNCSGKHAGFLCACAHSGTRLKGYIGYDHPLQQEIRGVMESLTGAVLGEDNCGIDGCAIPTYAVPLKGLAHGFAKMTTGTGLGTERAKASRRLIDACMAEPYYVAGTKRACTELMEIAPGKIFAKTGAEAVYVAALPEKGLAMAVKCEDGSTRAAEAMVAALLAKYFDKGSEEHTKLMALANKPMRNWNGDHFGDIRIASGF